MTALRVIAVNVPTECVCGRPTRPGKGYCSTRCRFAEDRHDTYDYRADNGEMGDDQ